MVHPAFVLICGCKYLWVLRAGSQPCFWHADIASRQGYLCRAPTKQEWQGAGEVDRSCWGFRPGLSQCQLSSDTQGSWILKLQDHRRLCILPSGPELQLLHLSSPSHHCACWWPTHSCSQRRLVNLRWRLLQKNIQPRCLESEKKANLLIYYSCL